MLANMKKEKGNTGILQGLFHCKIPPFVSLPLYTIMSMGMESEGHLSMEEGLFHHKTPSALSLHADNPAEIMGDKCRNLAKLVPLQDFSVSAAAE